MGSLVSREPVKITVEGREGEHIAIKPKLSVADRGTLTDAIMHIDGAVGKDTSVSINAGRYMAAMLEIAVTGWRLLDDAGAEVPFTRENVAMLDPDDALVDAALKAIAERNPTLSA